MAYLSDALDALQAALDTGAVELSPCEVHPDLRVLFDEAAGAPRITYASMADGRILSMAMFAVTDDVDGVSCFRVGAATVEAARGRGLATGTVRMAMEELRNGLTASGVGPFCVEAVVEPADEPGNRLARRLLSGSPETRVDGDTGEPVLQYVRLLE